MDPDGDRLPAEPAPAVAERPRYRRRWLWGGAAVLFLLLAVGGWVTLRAYQAYDNLTAAKTTIAADLQVSVTDLTELDPTRLAATVAEIQADAQRARNAVEDPLYRAATGLPWVGDDLSAVTSIATTVDNLAQQVLPSLISLADAVDPAKLAPHDSTVDLTPVTAAATTLHDANVAVADCVAQIAGVDRSGLTGAVRTAVDDLSTKLHSLAALTDTGARLTGLLPPMLGSEGSRRYLVVFQNLAELRSTGGIFGSYAILTADHGHLTVSGQGATSRTMGRFTAPVQPLTAEQLQLYDSIGLVPMDVNFTPDFPLAAQLFTTMYQERIDPAALDGVIAIDPVALAGILKGFEPVAVEGQTLTSDTLVKVLLSDAYTLFPDDQNEAQRDAFLATATAESFATLTTTPRDAKTVITALHDSADDRRLLVYSAHPEEQAELRKTGYTGELPATDPADAPTFGIFMSDRTYMGSKLGFYLSGDVNLTAGSCLGDGSRDVTAVVQLKFDAPSSGLPLHVAGAGPKAYILTDEFRAFARSGGALTAAEFDGTPVSVESDTDLNRSVGRFRVDLLPGTTSTVTLHYRLPPATGSVVPTVLIQPGVSSWPITAPAFAGCG